MIIRPYVDCQRLIFGPMLCGLGFRCENCRALTEIVLKVNGVLVTLQMDMKMIMPM